MLVTGAGNGLGAAIAVRMAAAGARAVLTGRDRSKLDAVAAPLGAAARVETVDVAGPVAPLWEIDPADWDEVFAVNLRGVFLMSRAFLPAMPAAGHGDVVNVASVTGKRPLPRRTP